MFSFAKQFSGAHPSLVLAGLGLLVGCAGLNLRTVDASIQKPSNVAVYFNVNTRSGDPVPGLTADQFHIYEDQKLVSPYESKQTILNPDVAAMHYTLLLLDMSGSVTGSGQRPALESAVSSFTARVGKYQQTAIYAFDGRSEIIPLRAFGPHVSPISLAGFVTKDPSTNLNGAVVAALKALEVQMEKSTAPLRFGTLVVFTDGTDHAGRVSRDELMQALDRYQFNVFAIGVGAEVEESELKRIGRSATVVSKDPTAVGDQFEKVATRIEGYSKSFYLLSYCSPARDGQHTLTIEAVAPQGEKGGMEYPFDAHGFGPNCDPNRKPNFDIHRPRMDQAPSTRR